MGDATTRALIGTNLVKARGTRHVLNHKGGTLSAIATFHPRFLLSQPARKAEAWADLRLFLECLET
jgi:DNA polymerase